MTHELYRHFDEHGALLYVGIAGYAVERTVGHKKAKSEWFDQIATITIQRYPDRLAAAIAEAIAIRREKPLFNKTAALNIGSMSENIPLGPERIDLWKKLLDECKTEIEKALAE